MIVKILQHFETNRSAKKYAHMLKKNRNFHKYNDNAKINIH